MGFYLNNTSAYGLFREDFSLTYYVDKTDMIRELVPIIELKQNGEERSDNCFTMLEQMWIR